MVEGLRGKKIVHVAVGALHCLAVTETGQVGPDLRQGALIGQPSCDQTPYDITNKTCCERP